MKKWLSIFVVFIFLFGNYCVSFALDPEKMIPVETLRPSEAEETDQIQLSEANLEQIESYNNNYGNEINYSTQEQQRMELLAQREENMNSASLSNGLSSAEPNDYPSTTFTAPFVINNSANENVVLNSGSLSLNFNLLSLFGKNGMDLNLKLDYNSKDAVLRGPLYSTFNYIDEESIGHRNTQMECFYAPGWNLNLSYIEKYGRGLYNNSEVNNNTLRLSDGCSVEIAYDGVLKGNGIDDLTFICSDENSESESILTYKDGKKEVFDSTYGYLKYQEDRFGNRITYDYEEIVLFGATFDSYVYNPSTYSKDVMVLSKITDTLGREIYVQRTMGETKNGNYVSEISFVLNSKILATIKFKAQKSQFGMISVVDQIITPLDGEKKNTVSMQYEEYIGGRMTQGTYQQGVSSHILLNELIYATGGKTQYEYSRQRKQYASANSETHEEIFKISSRKDISNGQIRNRKKYFYINDSSGYPYSYTLPATYGERAGNIASSRMCYYTIVEEMEDDTKAYNTTVYTFNNKHLQIKNETAISATHQLLKTMGTVTSDKEFMVYSNDKYYRIIESYLNLIIEEIDGNTSRIANVIDVHMMDSSRNASDLLGVKSGGGKILFFYLIKGQYLSCVEYDTVHNSYQKMLDYSLTRNGISFPDKNHFKNIAYAGGKFYLAYVSSTKKALISYDITTKSCAMNDIPVSFSTIKFMAEDSGTIYYKLDSNWYKYNGSWTKLSKISTSSGDAYAFNGILYVKEDGAVYQYANNSYTKLADTLPNTANKLIIYNSTLYSVVKADSPNTVQGLYRLNTESFEWELVTELYFTDVEFNICTAPNKVLLAYSNIIEEINVDSHDDSSRMRTAKTYDSNNMPLTATRTTFSADCERSVTTTSTVYDNYQNLTQQTDALGQVTKYTYDTTGFHLPTSVIKNFGTDNALQTTYTLSADKKKTVKEETFFDSKTVVKEYLYEDASNPGNVTTQISGEVKDGTETELNRVVIEYSSQYAYAYPTKQTVKNVTTNTTDFTLQNIGDIVTSSTYDLNTGLVKTQTDALGRTMTYTYNDAGWEIRTDFPDGTYKSVNYDINPSSQVNKITTSNNGEYVTADYFDGHGAMIKQTEKNKNGSEVILLTYAYYPSGKLKSAVDGNGNNNYYEYDSYGRTVFYGYLDENGDKQAEKEVSYDDYARLQIVTVGTNVSIVESDKLGRKVREQTTGSAGTSKTLYEYDYMGNVVKTTDPKNGIITNAYNNMGQLLSVTDQMGKITSYTYDARGNLNSMTTPGGSTASYEYDTLNRLIKQTDAIGNSEYAAFDKMNRLIASKDRNETVTSLSYKPNTDYLASKTAGELSVSYTYDSLGRTLSMQDETGTTTYGYYPNGSVETIQSPSGESIFYTYDNARNLTGVTGYSGQNISYLYDNRSRMKQVKKGGAMAASYEYDIAGNITKITTPEGTSEYTYDTAFQLTSQMNKQTNGTVVNSYSYKYDIAGNQIKKIDNGNETDYTYDALGRLTEEAYANGSKTNYWFDANNNIMTKEITHGTNDSYTFQYEGAQKSFTEVASHTVNYTYDANNRLLLERELVGGSGSDTAGLVETTKDYRYDANGNMVQKVTGGQVDQKVESYSFNVWNQMTGYQSEETTASYTYDGNGLRRTKTINGETTTFFWDRNYIVNEKVDESLTAQNLIGATGIFVRTESNADQYMFKNGHGDVVKLVSDGAVTQNYDFDAYGSQKGEPSTTDNNPFRYCGEYFDQESGLIYLRARYYDPSMGRFITEDPAKDGLNWYGYCGNNPIEYVDPSGNVSKKAADKRIIDNATYIKQAAKAFGINPAILAATIYAEQRLNVTYSEGAEDWTQMMLGMDCSVGVSQVRISTAKALEDRGYMAMTYENVTYTITDYGIFGKHTTKSVVSRDEVIYHKLTSNETNIWYAAAELKYRQDLWQNKYPEVSGRTAILATLYNRGDDAPAPHSNPQSNNFGNFAKENYYYMRELLGLD